MITNEDSVKTKRGFGITRELWSNFSTILALAPVEELSAAIASLFAGDLSTNVFGRDMKPKAPEVTWRLWQYKGHDWTVAWDSCEQASLRMAYTLSFLLDIQVLHFMHGKSSDWNYVNIYEKGNLLERYAFGPCEPFEGIKKRDFAGWDIVLSQEDLLGNIAGFHKFTSCLVEADEAMVLEKLEASSPSSALENIDGFLDFRLRQIGAYMPDFSEIPTYFKGRKLHISREDFCRVDDVENVDLAELYQEGVDPPRFLGRGQ